MTMERQMKLRNPLFLLFVVLVVIVFHSPIGMLFRLSRASELYSHIVLIPLVSVYLIYAGREKIFSPADFSYVTGGLTVAAGIVLFLAGTGLSGRMDQNDYLSLTTLGLATCLVGGFILFYGLGSFRLARFPLLFLVFMIPVPGFLMDRIIDLLQVCSAEVSYWLFRLTGVPLLRDGFTFHLPGMSIEVAKQCGGIRSTLSLFIVSVLAGHVFLRNGWRKVALSLAVFPITIFKNAVRIVMLSLLGTYVDPRILGSDLHRRGGIPFFFVALVLLGIVLWFVRKSELAEDRSAPTLNPP